MVGLGLFDRVLKIAKIGFAARRLNKSDTDDDRLAARRALAGLFEDARGVTMKFGQLMAGQEDDALAKLVDGIEARPLSDMMAVIEQDLGRPVMDIFDSIEESAAAASLGQVHKACLKDGGTVAIKIQYPDIKGAVEAEMTLFGLMPGVGPVHKWGFDLGGYKSALKTNMDRELDYRDEAIRQEQFRANVLVPGLIVPSVFTEFSARRILVQEWQEGVPLNEVATWPDGDKKNAARILLATLLHSLFVAGEVHGDPHAGNYMFKKSSGGGVTVVLVDFGCTVPVAREKRLALLKMILALREKTPLAPLETFAGVGFDAGKLCAISGTLATLAHILFKPFNTPGPFFVQQWDLKSEFEALLGENRWWFRASGEPSQILLLRAFQGLTQQLETIGCGLDWWQVLNDTIPRSILDEARAYDVPKLSAEILSNASYVSSSLKIAKSLRVVVTKDGNQIVSLKMPARAALNLEQLIPEDVSAYLRRSSDWDIDAILADMRARGLEPQEILDFEKENKGYRIWLE